MSTDSESKSAHMDSRLRKVVIVGIPGVGKSTVISKLLELMKEKSADVEVVNYGTTMMEEASRHYNVRSRDDMRKLPVEDQRKLQVYAAERISKIQRQNVIIDTHLFIATREGFWPGMPLNVLEALKPTHLVLISAELEEIKNRRESDTTRIRDPSTTETLQNEMDAAKSLLFASALICGCPAQIIENSHGQAEKAAQSIINSAFFS